MHSLLEERSYGGLRPSLGPFMSLIWIEGRPLTAIASQLSISKQACSQLANLAEAAGPQRLQDRAHLESPSKSTSRFAVPTGDGPALTACGSCADSPVRQS